MYEMTKDLSRGCQLGIIGAGTMGQGIAQVALQGGLTVLLNDVRPEAAAAGRDAVIKRINRLAEKGQLPSAQIAEMDRSFVVAHELGELRECEFVIEAVYEDLALKHDIFRVLEDAVRPDCILASNTSSLLIADIARPCRHRSRIAGMHFFNPVPRMRLVEVVRAPETCDEVVETLMALGKRLGREPIIARDGPGFIVNLGGRAYTTEAMHLLQENVASPEQIDAIMRDCCHFPMGPCELVDLTGIDVNFPVTKVIHEGYERDPRLRTAYPHRALFAAGRYGRKSGSGFYRYDANGEKMGTSTADFAADSRSAPVVVLAERDERLISFLAAVGLTVQQDDGRSPILAAPCGEDCSSFASRTGVDFRRLVAVDLSCDTERRVTLMSPPGATPEPLHAVATAIIASGRTVTTIKDSPGFVALRIRAMVANLGCEMAQMGVAPPAEIDRAIMLGLNYPKGPLAIAEEIGLPRLLSVLERMQALTGDDRYRPSQWLRRRAQLQLPVHTPD